MSIHELALLAGALSLAGCLVDQKLGETVGDEGGTGSGEGSGGPSSATDDASASQSGTSAQPGDDSSTGTPGEGTDPGMTDDGSGSSTDDGVIPDDCPLGPDSVRFEWNGPGFDPDAAGVAASFAAALAGDCVLDTVIEQIAADPGEYDLRLSLECTLDGEIDGQPVAAQGFSIDLDLYAADLDPALLPIASAQDVQLRYAADFWGMGWGMWFVIAREDGTILLDVVQGPYTSPTDPSVGVSEDVLALLDGAAWHDGLLVNAVPTACDPSVGKCGGEARAIELGWDGTPQTEVEVAQLGTVTTDIEETWYRANVRSALAYPMPMCTDLPEADYAITLWAEEP